MADKRKTPPKADRLQITITVNTYFLERLEKLGAKVRRNRSEMIDRSIEEYVARHETDQADAVQK